MEGNVPEIRLKGFTNPYEECKLGDIVHKLRSYPLSRDVETSEITGYRYIHYGDIHKQVADIVTSDELLPKIRSGDYISVEQGDLVLADASEDYTGIAEPCVILHKPKETVVAGLHTIALRPIETDPLYLYYLLHTDRFKKFCSYVGTGLKVFGITFSNLSKYEVKLPKKNEQTAIGKFIYTLDTTITLHKRKLDGLKELKKGYLQQMFPQTGETVPRVRFDGFTEPWGQQKLGDIATITMGQSPDSANYTENPQDHILVQGNADMKNGWVTPRVWTTQVTKSAQKGCLIMSVRAPVGDVGKTEHDVVLGRGVCGINGNEFLFQSLGKMKEDGFWTKISTGTTFESINSNDIREAILTIPCDKEQTAIGNFLHNLDKQITAQAEKLEQLKQLKVAYLQKMFV